MRKFYILLTILFAFPVYAAEVPRADLDEAERYFNNAYVHFMRRDYREAQIYLDHAINENTYMVDYYMLSALNLNRMGDIDGSMSALRSYIEVRPLDESAPRIGRNFTELDGALRTVLGTAPIPVNWKSAQSTVQTEWNTGWVRPFSIKGMGKIKSLGGTVCIPDTFGNEIFIHQGSHAGVLNAFTGENDFKRVQVPQPVIAFPMGDGTFLIFTANGDIYHIENLNESATADFTSQTESTAVTDAELISANQFALADPVERCITFYEMQRFDPIMRWFPPEMSGDLLFEPIAIERYADWLAIADRANSRIYILNITSREFFTINSVQLPRDLIWSSLGELFILNEDGEIYDFVIDFGTRSYANRNSSALYSGLNNIWSFFHSPYGDIICLDIGASMLYKSLMIPSRDDVPGYLSIYNPVMATNTENRESFIIDATFMSPFMSYANNTRTVAHAVWNNRSMRCNVMWQRPGNFDALFIHGAIPRGQILPINLRPAQVRRGSDISAVIPSFWLLHKSTLTNVIVDSSISFTMDDMMTLLKFCMMNGLELDIYAREIPSLSLTRASAFTGGKTIYSLRNAIELPVQRSHMQIQIPLPVELSSSGYPGRSMLGLYLDAGMIQSRAWMPLWPDMFTR